MDPRRRRRFDEINLVAEYSDGEPEHGLPYMERRDHGVHSNWSNNSNRNHGNRHRIQSRERFSERPEGAKNRDGFKDRNKGSNPNDAGRSHKKFIGYQKLKAMADETNAGKLLLWIADESDALADLLKSDLKPDWYSLLVNICRRIVSADHQKHALKKVLTVFVTSHFLDQNLFDFVTQKKYISWPDAEQFYGAIIEIIRNVISLLPEDALKCRMPLSLLQNMIQETSELNGKIVKDDLLQSVGVLEEELKKVERKLTESKVFRKKPLPFSDTDTPPEDFRTLSVVPTASDLRSEAEPFLRAILAKGAYRNEDHYLDVQFRLMREDFIQPLRESIHEFRKNGCKRDYRSSDIRLYFDVQILGMTTVNGINHILQFDVTSLKSIKWEHSKRFLYGSLLCLSKDNFETVLFATVSFRNPKYLKEGIINVEFKSELETVFCSSSSEVFVMVETTTYFEAYCPILEGLQETNPQNHLQKYFIYSETQLQPPRYLLGGVRKYDLSSLTKDGGPVQVPILNTMSWPPVERLNLNDSQTKAVQLALTKEMAIIQGPPGTGKTYVGLKVMRVLLHNQKEMAANKKSPFDPILVVCYTNHALDQFLEGVVEFCPEGVVRVGGKSSSTVMEQLNLKNLKKNQELERSVKRALWTKHEELDRISSNIKRLKSLIDSFHINIQHEKLLEQYMLPEHYMSLMLTNTDSFQTKNQSQTKYWLNSLNTFDRDTLPELVKCHLTKLVLQMQEPLHMNLSEVQSGQLERSIQSMSIIERARTYRGWLQRFCSSLDVSISVDADLLEKSKRGILPNSTISHFIPTKIFEIIKSMDFQGHEETVEGWVLGLNKSLSDQLDDIEHLIHFFSQSDDDNNDDFDDDDGAVNDQNARQIDTDRKEEDEIAKATSKIREGDAFLLIKAEKLGLGNDTEDGQSALDDSWQTVTRKKSLSFSKIKKYLTNIQPMTEEEEKTVDNVWNLDIKKRFSLYNLWIQKYRNDVAGEVKKLVREYKYEMDGKKEIKIECDLDILKRARVIGMTTTGAAKYRALLQAISCRIIVVEEAAEVLEAHIITSLNENCKHLILIGDHQQLKPNPTVYTLAKDYHLDLSLFERLINNGIQHVTLKEQHRMRKSISKIMRHIYPNLQDHISVTNYENIRGVEKNIYFINHREQESHVNESRSKSNAHEASFLVAVLKYFLLQGYEPSQITILATYVGQVLLLKKELKAKQVNGNVRVTSVDNFQGEENDIILLSLVRSNDQSNVGFLKVDNRVCVALSRAKKGLFAIGNFKMLASKSDLWKKIVQTATEDAIYGDTLPVVCPNHPNFKKEISCPEDFQKKCPEGGCGRPCEFRLQCGHTCPLKCHGYDSQHKKAKCNKTCAKKCLQGHPCKRWCGQECGNCTEKVEKTIPRCGHTDKMPCHKTVHDAICSQTCRVLLECQHHCKGTCGDCHEKQEHAKCCIPAEYFWPCDHISRVPCYRKPSEYSCPKKCQATLECGHTCTGTCSECLEGILHIACKKTCSNVLPCGHQCLSRCGIPCPPCPKVCSTSCRHSKCDTRGRACGDECTPCQEPCQIGCIHRKCGKKCHEECDIEPCQERCKKIIDKCKHRCSGLCGELCVCGLCDKICVLNKETPESDLKSKTGSKPETFESSHFPLSIKIPSCGHIFRLNELDAYVDTLNSNDHQFYFPCPGPFCKSIIQDCFHYTKTIKRKELQKQQEKTRIRQKSRITSTQNISMLQSQRILESKDLNGVWYTITKCNINDFNDCHEIISLNLKCKYAYVLCDIQLLLETGESFVELSASKMVTAIQGLGKSITYGQISDCENELRRLLLNIYFHKLMVYCDPNCDEMKCIQKEVKEILKMRRLEQSALARFWQIIESLEKAIQKAAFYSSAKSQANFTVMKNMLVTDLTILDSEAGKMLCDIIGR